MTPYMIRKIGEGMLLNPTTGHKKFLARLAVSGIAEQIEAIYNEAVEEGYCDPGETLNGMCDFVSMWLSDYIVRIALVGREKEAAEVLLSGLNKRVMDMLDITLPHLEKVEAGLKENATKNAPADIRDFILNMPPEQFRAMVLEAERLKIEGNPQADKALMEGKLS